MNWIKRGGAMVYVLLVLSSAGCVTSKDRLLSHGSETMRDVWARGGGYSARGIGIAGMQGTQSQQLMDARALLRRPLSAQDSQRLASEQLAYSRSAQNEIERQFHRLPNPDLVMYVFPHLAGTDPVPVPGYSTVFPLYQRVQYAMPGERTEPY